MSCLCFLVFTYTRHVQARCRRRSNASVPSQSVESAHTLVMPEFGNARKLRDYQEVSQC